MRPLTRWFVLVALLTALGACSDSPRERPVQELVGSTMGTTFSIKIVAPPENIDLPELQRDIETALDGLAVPGVTTWHPEGPWTDPSIEPIPHDPAAWT